MFRRALHAVERTLFGVEMAITSVRRLFVRDIGTILGGFDRMVADLDEFIGRETAANFKDQKRLDTLYGRIDQRRENVARALVVANNISKLTASK